MPNSQGVKYSRLRTKNGHIIGSRMCHCDGDIARVNYTIAVS